nr:unnamed protein product [Spirometra erinaceieuropaei]
MLRLFLCLTLACGTLGQGTQTEYTVKPNSDYVYAELLDCNLLSMTVDGVQISALATRRSVIQHLELAVGSFITAFLAVWFDNSSSKSTFLML